MDSLTLIKVFREVALHGNFSQAANKLSLSKASASKYVAELESRCGVRLLNRSTRSVSLTDAGALLLERSAAMLDMLAQTQAELRERADQPSGRLRIAVPYSMCHGELPGALAQFMSHYPKLSLSLQLSNQPLDLADEGLDLALRIGPIENENLIVRRLVPLQFVVCASPRYWTRHGRPAQPDDLHAHAALTLSSHGSAPRWRLEVDGKAIEVPVQSRMDATEVAPLIQMALHDFGVLYLPSLSVQPYLDRGELEAVLLPHGRTDVWLYAAYLQRRHNSAALRALLDFLESRIGPRLRAQFAQ